MTETCPSYTLVPGTYWVGDNLVRYHHRTRIKTSKLVVRCDPESEGIAPHLSISPDPNLLSCCELLEQAPEGVCTGDDGCFLEYDKYKEFKALFLRAVVDKTIDPGQVVSYRIDKCMTIANVVSLLTNVFEGKIPFRRLRKLSKCCVIDQDGVQFPGGRVVGGEIHIFVSNSVSGWVTVGKSFTYFNEKSKIRSYLDYFAAYVIDDALEKSGSRWFVCSRVGPRPFDPQRVFELLDVYFGREDFSKHCEHC